MRKLLAIVLVLASVYGGYWFIGSTAVERGLKSWIADRASEGWVAEYSSLNTVGFPSYFDTTITDLELADPETGLFWRASELKLYALSYRPNEIIAQWPNIQHFATPLQKLTLNTSDMRASVAFDANTNLSLNRSTFDLADVLITSDLGWETSLEKGILATRQTLAAVNTHDIFFEATKFRPADALRVAIDSNGALPEIFETLKIDATVGFDAAWDKFAIETRRPQPTSINLKLAQATWGQLDLKAAGEVTIDAQGIPTGIVTIKATNWKEMLQIGVSTGLIPADTALTLERGLGLIAGLSGNPKTLDAPLTFSNGRILFGPIPIGAAPRIIIR